LRNEDAMHSALVLKIDSLLFAQEGVFSIVLDLWYTGRGGVGKGVDAENLRSFVTGRTFQSLIICLKLVLCKL
jgi:hypothetical protein